MTLTCSCITFRKVARRGDSRGKEFEVNPFDDYVAVTDNNVRVGKTGDIP